MAYVMAVTNIKGGVGKTTTSINLSVALSQLGKKTLLIDIDSQTNSSSCLIDDYQSCRYTVRDLFANRKFNIEHAIYQANPCNSNIENLFVVPSHVDLKDTYNSLLQKGGKDLIMKKHLRDIQEQYDFIIFDCPPGADTATLNALHASDSIIIPVIDPGFSMDGIGDIFSAIEDSELELFYRVLYNEINKSEKKILAKMEERLSGYSAYKTKIRKSAALKHSESDYLPLFLSHGDKSALVDYKNLAKEILQDASIETTQ